MTNNNMRKALSDALIHGDSIRDIATKVEGLAKYEGKADAIARITTVLEHDLGGKEEARMEAIRLLADAHWANDTMRAYHDGVREACEMYLNHGWLKS